MILIRVTKLFIFPQSGELVKSISEVSAGRHKKGHAQLGREWFELSNVFDRCFLNSALLGDRAWYNATDSGEQSQWAELAVFSTEVSR